MDAFDEGVEAFEHDDDLDDNPYKESSTRHDEWDDGWGTAARACIEHIRKKKDAR